MENSSKSGWIVVLAGVCINLTMGFLYAWSVVRGGIPEAWGWSNADKALPFSVICIAITIAMIPAGRLQDKIGPKIVSTVGGILIGLGFLVCYFSGSSLAGFVVGFGVLGGIGMGASYASATPPAVKWFPPAKTGMIAGIVVAGFGLSPVIIAPLTSKLLALFQTTIIDSSTGNTIVEKGVSMTMLVYAIAFPIIIVALSQMLTNPPVSNAAKVAAAATSLKATDKKDFAWKEMMSTSQFYLLWFMYFAGSAAGLMFISVAQELGKKTLGEYAFFAVVVLACGNAGGRVLAGIVSDIIGRQWTIFCSCVLQSLVVFCMYLATSGAAWSSNAFIMMTLVALIGANFGSNLALFPAVTKDYFGVKNFGLNYGILFTAWGTAGLVMPWINGFVKDVGMPQLSYLIVISMLMTAAVFTFLSRSIANRKTGSSTSLPSGAGA
ncbi:L-lactate MFS transporter [Desulforegula conservatrix]|uniref:L-lactate MFS transporter n=1 Tax=Desulforegula conservatrix TaxID=153026 RepID=UPI000410AE26|nr:OFA family MFS transporter [Desulforegula conservatrix]